MMKAAQSHTQKKIADSAALDTGSQSIHALGITRYLFPKIAYQSKTMVFLSRHEVGMHKMFLH